MTWTGKHKAILGLVALIAIFILMTYLAKEYEDTVRVVLGEEKYFGMFFYVLVTTIATSFAPISMLPLIPLASNLWGWPVAATLSVIGWVTGAQIAFMLARHYGKPLVQKIVSIEKLEKFERQIPEDHLFWSVVVLRIFVSVELLSWALGLFSRMKNTPYILATFIGVTPFAFIFAYTGTLSLEYQLAVLSFACFIIFLWYVVYKLHIHRKSTTEPA